jgi:hypothetical protein
VRPMQDQLPGPVRRWQRVDVRHLGSPSGGGFRLGRPQAGDHAVQLCGGGDCVVGEPFHLSREEREVQLDLGGIGRVHTARARSVDR